MLRQVNNSPKPVLNVVLAIMIIISIVVHTGFKVKLTRFVLHDKNTQPCQLQK